MRLGEIDPSQLPVEIAISTLTLAELAAGPHAANDDLVRARRQQHLQHIEASIEALPFDPDCARAYGIVYSVVEGSGRKARGAHAVHLMIAATALAHDLRLCTLNAKDLRGLGELIEIVDLNG